MRLRHRLITWILVPLVLLGLPIQAAAQFTLKGQLVEQLPGGGTPESPYLALYPVQSTGDKSWAGISAQECVGLGKADCIQPDGRFTLLDVPSGLYIAGFLAFGDDVTHVGKFFNVHISGDTDIGVVPLFRRPFALQMEMGQIPSAGGPIPLTVRAETRWDVPTLPVTVRLRLRQEDVNGENSIELPSIDFTWPAGLADSGVVALPPINVSANAPAGAESCFEMTIVLRDQPNLILGEDIVCRGKQP